MRKSWIPLAKTQKVLISHYQTTTVKKEEEKKVYNALDNMFKNIDSN